MLNTTPASDTQKLDLFLGKLPNPQYENFTSRLNHQLIPYSKTDHMSTLLEIGAGSGDFAFKVAETHPNKFVFPIEICRSRAKSLLKRAKNKALPNLIPVRGNPIPSLIHGVPENSIDEIFILYPCPWPKRAHIKNRWHVHPVMPHLIKILKPGGIFYLASDQEFYVDEFHYCNQTKYNLTELTYGPIVPTEYNYMNLFGDEGRSYFEKKFLHSQPERFEITLRK